MSACGKYFVSRLPPELICHILARLAPDLGNDEATGSRIDESSKKDLCSCSLVCHAWQEIARSFLFADVVCTFADGTSDTGRLAQFQNFLRLSPVICTCVRVLTLVSDPKPPSLPGRVRARVPVDTELCCSVLSLLPRLQTILFREIYLTGPVLPHPRLRTAAVEIHYKGRSYAPLEGVLWLVGMFDDINMLQIDSRYLCPPPIESRSYHPRTKISSLCTDVLNFRATDGASNLIRAVRHETTLKSLHLNTMLFDGEWTDLYSSMKSGVGAELTHLGFTAEWPDVYGPAEPGEDVDRHGVLLALCPQLESFTLHFNLWSFLPDNIGDSLLNNRQIWNDISRLMPNVSLTVRSIFLGLGITTRPGCVYLRGMEKETEGLEAVMTRRFEKSLPVVVFKSTFGQPFSGEEQECLKRLFPMLTQEGLIRFDEST